MIKKFSVDENQKYKEYLIFLRVPTHLNETKFFGYNAFFCYESFILIKTINFRSEHENRNGIIIKDKLIIIMQQLCINAGGTNGIILV